LFPSTESKAHYVADFDKDKVAEIIKYFYDGKIDKILDIR